MKWTNPKNDDKKRTRKQKPSIKAGDTVQVIAGKDKGQIGKVIKIDWDKERVLVEGVNKVKRHTKPNQNNQQGGIVTMEAPIHYSNILLYSTSASRGVRHRIDRSVPGMRKRVCVKTNNIIE